jgi:(heptosyl)LPS beta-1,4-glucosyltransferase
MEKRYYSADDRPEGERTGARMDRETITGIVMTFNEEHNIGACLDSLTWVDELIVADTGSTDRTVEHARPYTEKILDLPWQGYGPTRNLAMKEASGDWILFVDADERITGELRDEILNILSSWDYRYAAYRISRKSNFVGRWIKGCGWYPGYVVRLSRRGEGTYTDATVHESLEVKGSIGTIKADILHFTDPDLEYYFKKFNLYTTLAADDMVRDGRKPRLHYLFIRPLAAFIKMYILKRGYRDGFEGFILCVFSSFYVFTKYAKAMFAWRMKSKIQDGQ